MHMAQFLRYLSHSETIFVLEYRQASGHKTNHKLVNSKRQVGLSIYIFVYPCVVAAPAMTLLRVERDRRTFSNTSLHN